MELKGNLDSQSLQEIFTTLAHNKQIGTLIVSEGQNKKYVYFARAGVRLLTSGRRKSVPLGDLLVQQNKITEDQLQAVLERQSETKEMMGKILTDWGLVTEEDIDEAVGSQIEEEIFDIFSWENATFEFSEGAPPKELFDPNQRATRLTFDVLTLVQKANERVRDIHEVKKLLPPLDGVYALGEFTELEYYEKDDTDPTKQVVSRIDGVKTIGEIISELSLPKIEVARILDDLITQKKVEKVLRAHAGIDETAGKSDLEGFIIKCEREIFNDPDNYTLRERLAQAYYDIGDLEKAILHLNLVSKAQLKDGRLEKALATTKRVAEVVPEDAEVRERLLHIYLEMRNIGEALEEASILANLFAENEEKEKVRNMFKLVLELVPEDTDIRRKLINVHIDIGDRDAAAQEYEEIARIAIDKGEKHKLEEIYLKILRLAPHRSDIKKKLNAIKTRPSIHIPRSRFRILRRLVKWVVVLAVLGAVGFAGYREWNARQTSDPVIIKIRALIADKSFDKARTALARLRADNPYTILVYVDLENIATEVNSAEKRAQEGVENEKRLRIRKDRDAFTVIVEAKNQLLADSATPPAKRVEKLKDLHKAMVELSMAKRKNDWITKAKAWLVTWDEHHRKARDLLARAKALEKDGNVVEARKIRGQLRKKYADTEFALNLLTPYQITSEPTGAKVFLRGEDKGLTPIVLYEPLDSEENLSIQVEKDGYVPETLDIYDLSSKTTWHFVLRRKPLWVIRIDAPVEAAPVIDGNSLYFGSRDGFLYAVRLDKIDAADKASWFPSWKYKNPDRPGKLWAVLHEPVLRAGVAFYGSTDSYLYAVRNGRELWHFHIGGILRHEPVFVNNLLVFGCNVAGKGRIFALEVNPSDDTAVPRWIFPPNDAPIRKAVTAPAVYPEKGVAFLGDSWGEIHVVNLLDGSPLGIINTKVSIKTSFLVYNDTLFFVGSDRALHAYDVTNVRKEGAREIWTCPLPDSASMAPVQFAGTLIQVTDSGHIIVLDVRTKGEYVNKWTYKIPSPVKARPALSGTDILVGNFERTLHAFHLTTGKLRWSFKTPGKIQGIAVRRNIIYCTCEEGIVFAVNER
jgi:outer membrane protein assembly factor BamB/tetratricopeptide (TPR) repeat protein